MALLFAPLLLLQALTGSLLLFRAELATWFDPAESMGRGPSARVPLSALVSAATGAQPGFRVTRIFLPATVRDTAFVHLASADGTATRFATVDPGTGRVLSAGSIWRFPAEAILQLHYGLNSGKPGLVVILLNGAALYFLMTTGLLYWWPGKGRVVSRLAVAKNAPPRARLRQWHRSIGVVLTPLVIFSAATGLLLVVPDLAAAGGSPGAERLLPVPSRIDAAFDRARAAFPSAEVRDVRFPAADRIDVNFRALRYNSQVVDIASVRLSDSALLKRVAAEENKALWISVLPLHSGAAFGLGGVGLLLVEGLALMFLAVTGPVMWWHARRRKRGAGK